MRRAFDVPESPFSASYRVTVNIRRDQVVRSVLFAVLAFYPGLVQAASPQEIRQKLGVYIWGRVPDLVVAASDVKRLGADQVIRTFIGPWSDTPPYKADLRPLSQKLASRGYQKILHDFQVIMLTAYDSVSYREEYGVYFKAIEEMEKGETGQTARRVLHHPSHPSSKVCEDLRTGNEAQTQNLLVRVREEFRLFSYELAKLDRTIIISNWEAENDVPDAKCWPWFVQYLQARIDGIIAGRREAREKGYPAKVFSAFEFTIVPGFQGEPSGLVEMGAKLSGLDYLSYSSWRSIGSDFDALAMKNSFRYAFQLIRGFAREAGLPQRTIIGEFGEYWNMHADAERLKAIVEVSIDEGIDYLFNWVLYDQPGEKDEWGRDASHMGKFFLNHSLTPQGKVFLHWLSERPVRINPRD